MDRNIKTDRDPIRDRDVDPRSYGGNECNAVARAKDFGWAIEMLRQGASVFRQSWNGKGMCLKLQVPDHGSKMSRPYIYIRTAQNDLVPWVASHGDLLGYDWEVLKQ